MAEVNGVVREEQSTLFQDISSSNGFGERFARAREAVFGALVQSNGRPYYYYSNSPKDTKELDAELSAMVESGSQCVNAVLAAVSEMRKSGDFAL